MGGKHSPTDEQGRRFTPANAVWAINPGQLAIGASKIWQKITDSVPEDHEALWEDDDHTRFCIRPHPSGRFATYDENTLLTPNGKTSGVGIYLIGRGVLIKVKSISSGGSSREPETMKLIRKQAPSVPVPEVFHHWNDSDWDCHITIMRFIPGNTIAWIWYALDPTHQQRLAEEIADHIQAVAEIQSDIAIYANGESLADSRYIPPIGVNVPDQYYPGAPYKTDNYFNMKQLEDCLTASNWNVYPTPLEGLGDRFHLCHMDPSPWHFFVSNGVAKLPEGPSGLIENVPLEEQAKLHINGIIDWERAGFYPRCMVSYQFQKLFVLDLPTHQYGKPTRTGGEFSDAVAKALVKRGFLDKQFTKYRWEWKQMEQDKIDEEQFKLDQIEKEKIKIEKERIKQEKIQYWVERFTKERNEESNASPPSEEKPS